MVVYSCLNDTSKVVLYPFSPLGTLKKSMRKKFLNSFDMLRCYILLDRKRSLKFEVITENILECNVFNNEQPTNNAYLI